MRRGSLIAAALAAFTLAFPISAATAAPDTAPSPARPAPAPIQWTECGTTFKGECATIPAPVSWRNPVGPTFQLAIGRLKALDPARRIGVLFVHPGGPGSSGIDRYTTGRGIPDDSVLRQVFDIVTVDPRGVGRSNPIQCSADLVGATPTHVPANEAEYRALLEFNAKLYADCKKNTGPLIDNVDTVSAVRDVDAIRAALGEDKITFYGASYATQVGQQYAELFPGRIRAMTIDSNMDHSITSALRYLDTTTDDQENSLLEFSRWCDTTTACPLYGRDTLKTWDTLYAEAKAGTLVDPDTGAAIDDEALRVEMFIAMYNPKTRWFGLATRLRAMADQTTAPAAARPAADTVANPYPAIWCSDWKWDVDSFTEFDGIRRKVAATWPHSELSPFWSDVTYCLGWPGPLNNPQHKLRISGTPKILITKSAHDVATPKAWTLAVADQVPNSVLFQYDGIGHGDFGISACSRAVIENYLVTTTPPAPGAHCPPEYPTQPPASATTTTTTTTTRTRPLHG